MTKKDLFTTPALPEEWEDSSEYDSSYSSSDRHHCRSITPYRVDISSGVTLSWSKISCYAPVIGRGACGRSVETGEYRQLLFDLYGVIQPNTLMAVMGASGAGKTTLLNILTCRNLGNLKVDGNVKTNGVDMGSNIKCVSAYVQQNDVFNGRLKVREHLIYQAALRMGREYTREEQEMRVEKVIIDMGLERCADDYIIVNSSGRSSFGISGSERKLLSIGSELLTDPPLIFCDEPTTGLDSMMAERVVRHLQKQAMRGKTIVCTIHQPASHIFEHFDQLTLLAEGRQTFQGTPERALQFFGECGFPCPKNYNPADHFIHTLAIRPGLEEECRTKVIYTATKFRGTAEYHKIERQIKGIDKMMGDPDFKNVIMTASKKTPYRATWSKQVTINAWKMFLDQIRDPSVMFSRIIQNIISVFIYCVLFFRQDYNQIGVQNINGASFNIILHMTFLAILQLSSFVRELPTFYRDHHNGLYRTDTYFLARNLADLPIFLILSVTVVTFCYWLIGYYAGFLQFVIYTVTLMLVYQFSLSFQVYFMGIISGRLDIAINISPPIRVVFMLVSGYNLNEATIPSYIQWLKYFSWQRYSFKILTLNQWLYVPTIECLQESKDSCYHSGNDVLQFLNFPNADGLWLDFLLLILIGLGWRFLAWVVLYFKAKERKRN